MPRGKRDDIRDRRVTTVTTASKESEVAAAAAELAKQFGLRGVPTDDTVPSPGQEAEQESGAPRIIWPGRASEPAQPPAPQPQTASRVLEINKAVRRQRGVKPADIDSFPGSAIQPSELAGLARNVFNLYAQAGFSPAESLELTKSYALLELGWQVAALVKKLG